MILHLKSECGIGIRLTEDMLCKIGFDEYLKTVLEEMEEKDDHNDYNKYDMLCDFFNRFDLLLNIKGIGNSLSDTICYVLLITEKKYVYAIKKIPNFLAKLNAAGITCTENDLEIINGVHMVIG
jgi:hypothetical protein